MKSQRLDNHAPKNFPGDWLRECKSPEEKAEKIRTVQGSIFLFDQLKQMIQQRYDSTAHTNDTDYNSASWSHLQAHRNGKLEAYEEIFKLLP